MEQLINQKKVSVLLAFIFILFITISLPGQVIKTVDSLKAAINKSQHDTNQVNLYLKIAGLFREKPNTSKNYLENALILAGKLHYSDGLYRAYKGLGYVQYLFGNYLESLNLNEKSLVVAIYLKDSVKIGESLLNCAEAKLKSRNFAGTLNNLETAKIIFQKLNDQEHLAAINMKFGFLSFDLEKPNEAIEYLSKAEQYYYQTKNYMNYVRCLDVKGGTYCKLGEFNQSEKYYQLAMKVCKDFNVPYEFSALYIGIAFLKNSEGDFKSSVDYGLKSYDLALKDSVKRHIWLASKILSKSYFDLKDYHKAYTYLLVSSETWQKMFNLEREQAFRDFQGQYLDQKRRSEIELLQKKLIIQKSHTIFTIVVSIFLIVLFSLLFLFNRQKHKIINQKHQLIEQETLALKERLEYSNRELASKALFMASVAETKVKLLETIRELTTHLDYQGKQIIQSKMADFEIITQQDFWKEFEAHFENVQAIFFSKLSELYPDLTPNDRKICAFLKLNLSTKEISMLQNKNIRTIESARYRLKKRMGLSEEESLSQYLANL